jgi:hypothetical protein
MEKGEGYVRGNRRPPDAVSLEEQTARRKRALKQQIKQAFMAELRR